MRKIGSKNDWWDWGVILLIVAGGTIILWAGVWVAHSWADIPRSTVTAKVAPPALPAPASDTRPTPTVERVR